MIRRRRSLTGAVVAAAALTLTACSSSTGGSAGSGASGGAGAAGGKKSTYVVGYSQSNNAEPYRAQLNLQLQYFAKQHKDLKLLPIADAHQDSSTQVSQVQQFIAQKVDALIVSPNEAAPLTAAVQQACNAHIPVVILDRSVNTPCISAFIGGDNVQAGMKAGKLAVQLLPNGGNVVELQGILSNQPQIDRDKGFREAVASNPNIHIVAHREAKWLKEDATKVMNQFLSQYNKIDLVYAENDPMALGAYLAASGANKAKQIKFIGTDGLAIPDGGIRAVQQGQLTGTFIYPTCAMQAVDTVEKLLTGQTVDKKQVLNITAVTPQNAAGLYQKNDFSTKS